MTVVVASSEALFRAARAHLRGHIEQVGFFLADFDAEEGAFVLREWRPMPPPEVIKWAWDADACLVEAHSHGDAGIASFSPSDLYGFDEWVPHVRWRLRGRPYAAIVTAGDSFDALAWLDDEERPVQVTAFEVDGVALAATARTLPRLRELREPYG